MNLARAILWLFGFAAIFAAGAPSFAHAHAGHGHHAAGHHLSGHAHHTQSMSADVAGKVQASAHKSLEAGILAPADLPTGSGCNDRGCCSASHCMSCGAAIAPATGTVWPPASKVAYGGAMASAMAGGPADRLRRPPKSLS